jgi:uncharacterized protein (DUF427 family)
MMKAIWNNTVIAESDDIVVVENNSYFPISALNRAFIVDSAHRTTCPWKGVAGYYTLVVDGQRNENAAWYYANPSQAAAAIKDRVAFWKGVKVG